MNGPVKIAYIDVLTSLLVVFFVMFILSEAKKDSTQANVISKAEFIVQLEWDKGSYSDIDLWVEAPNGDIVSFKNKDSSLVTLDRDDLGASQNKVEADSGTVVDDNRHELVSIRGIIPGKFTINVMAWAMKDGGKPIKTKVSVIKLNPYREVFTKEVILVEDGEEKTMGIFEVKKDGSVGLIDTTTQTLIGKKV